MSGDRDDILANLTDDGDTYDLDNRRTLRLRIEPDDAPVSDLMGDSFGKFDGPYDYIRHGKRERPSSFTGNAEKLQVDRGGWVWWEPPADGPKRGTDAFRNMRQHIRDLWECGYSVVIVELLDDDTDAYGQPIVREVASLGGCDITWSRESREYLREIVGELLDEIGAPA